VVSLAGNTRATRFYSFWRERKGDALFEVTVRWELYRYRFQDAGRVCTIVKV
jgi:hypothetical protein